MSSYSQKTLVDSGYLLGGGGTSEGSKLNQNGFDVSKGQDIICEASECYAKATDKVTVTVGTLGVISLALCNDCVFEIQGDHTGMTALKNAPFEGKCSKCAHYSKQIAKLAKAFINADDESIRQLHAIRT